MAGNDRFSLKPQSCVFSHCYRIATNRSYQLHDIVSLQCAQFRL